MEKDNLKYIKHIEIQGLWGRYDVNWELNPDVNILVGENGTGKSTILQFFNTLVGGKYGLFDRFVLDIDNRNSAHLRKFKNIIIEFLGGESIFARYFPDNKKLEIDNTVMVHIDVDFIKTFDSNPSEPSDRKKQDFSPLGKELDKIMQRYINYQLTKSNQFINENISKEQAFGKRLWLIETLNKLFEPTKKTIDTTVNEIAFKTERGERINWIDLSSGEKQLLIILLTVLCQDEKPSILLMDEPEISLHLRWQYELIEILRTLNPNCQLIIATHSPSIFNHGWRDKVFWIEDIVKEMEAAHE